jgi:hypothetical protein
MLRAILSANMLCSVEPSLSQSEPAWAGVKPKAKTENAQAETRDTEENFMMEIKI